MSLNDLVHRVMPHRTPPARQTDHPLFDKDFYLETYADAREAGIEPYEHYCKIGVDRGYCPNELFDTTWYLDRYPGVKQQGLNPLDHYYNTGALHGFDPSLLFSSYLYCLMYPDVQIAGANPLEHYLHHGRRENRKVPPSAVRGSVQISGGSPANFSPRAIVVFFVAEGLRLYSDFYFSDKDLEIIDDVNLLLDQSFGMTEAYDRLSDEISTRLWREIYFRADVASQNGVEHEPIGQYDSFLPSMLLPLESKIPAHPNIRAAMLKLLYLDLKLFVSFSGGLAGEWGGIFVSEDNLVVRSARRAMVKPREEGRPKRRVSRFVS